MEIKKLDRPDWHEYYMGIALAVRKRANCVGNRVGALLVRDGRMIAAGYNGTPAGMPNCDEGGCDRCANRDKYKSGEAYDVCICVHAEANALLSAARFGISTEGANLYTSMRPCFSCAKELLQSKVHAIHFLHDWQHPREDLRPHYDNLLTYFPGGVHRVDMEDPDLEWAVSNARKK